MYEVMNESLMDHLKLSYLSENNLIKTFLSFFCLNGRFQDKGKHVSRYYEFCLTLGADVDSKAPFQGIKGTEQSLLPP